MNKPTIAIIILCLLAFSCKQPKNSVDPNHVELSIVQNGKIIQPVNGTILLDKAAFNLVFKFTTPNFILVNASYTKDLMFKALKKEDLVTQPQFTLGNIIAKTYFNTDKSIYTSNIASSAWLQEDEDKHMFNSLESNDGTYTATRQIENSFDLDENQNTKIEDINKPLYLVFVVIDKNSDLKNNTELQRIAIKIDWIAKAEDAQEARLTNNFNQLLQRVPFKNIPVSDDTNFNNTEIVNVLNKEEANLLQLGKIYPNFYTAGYNYSVFLEYKLNLFQNLKTLVVTVLKGEHEMETVLINYNLDNFLIDHQVIAYDEIADGMHVITSTIENNEITITQYGLNKEKDVTQRFSIQENGIILPIDVLEKVLKTLDINKKDIYNDFFSSVELTYNKTLLLIPTIAKQTEDELVLNVYLLLVNAETGEIESKFSKKRYWHGDALTIYSIVANYQPYKISDNSEIIGINVDYSGSSAVNPYTSTELTLFIREGDSLKPILNAYETYSKSGENDGEGNGFYIETSKTITPDTETTTVTNIYNLKINTVIEEVQYINGKEHLVSNATKIRQLIFENGIYKEANKD